MSIEVAETKECLVQRPLLIREQATKSSLEGKSRTV